MDTQVIYVYVLYINLHKMCQILKIHITIKIDDFECNMFLTKFT